MRDGTPPDVRTIRFEIAMGLSRSAIPPLICLEGLGRVCRLIIETPSTRTFPTARSTEMTRPVSPGDDLNLVILLNADFDKPAAVVLGARHQITSGASETIFMNFLSRNSL